MKFYFEGQLIRTSKNHEYKYACIERHEDWIKVIGCSATKENAEKIKSNVLGRFSKVIRSGRIDAENEEKIRRISGWEIVELEAR